MPQPLMHTNNPLSITIKLERQTEREIKSERERDRS